MWVDGAIVDEETESPSNETLSICGREMSIILLICLKNNLLKWNFNSLLEFKNILKFGDFEFYIMTLKLKFEKIKLKKFTSSHTDCESGGVWSPFSEVVPACK